MKRRVRVRPTVRRRLRVRRRVIRRVRRWVRNRGSLIELIEFENTSFTGLLDYTITDRMFGVRVSARVRVRSVISQYTDIHQRYAVDRS